MLRCVCAKHRNVVSNIYNTILMFLTSILLMEVPSIAVVSATFQNSLLFARLRLCQGQGICT